jgi:hypothetical protein
MMPMAVPQKLATPFVPIRREKAAMLRPLGPPCELFGQTVPKFNMRLWNMSGAAQDINHATVRLFVCSSCGHMAFFRT